MPRRRKPRPSPFPRRSPRSLSLFMSGHLLAHALELGRALELDLLALGAAGRRSWRRRWRVLGLADGHEAEHAVHQLQVALDLEQRLRRRPVLEERVERAPLLADQIRELAHAPVLDLAHGAALVLDKLLDALLDFLRALLPRVGMDQDDGFIAAVRHALPPSG